MKPRTLDHVLSSLSRAELLQAIGLVQRRRDLAEVLLSVLQARLNQVLATNGHRGDQDDRIFTVPEAAQRLKLTRARIYELCRSGVLPKVAGLGTQVRIPASALHALNGTQRAS